MCYNKTMESLENLFKILVRQNSVIIRLLARSTLGADTVRALVVRGKRDPSAYVRLYNALDGTISVSEAARLAGVAQPTMTEVLKGWEAAGIVYDLGDTRRPLYKNLFLIETTNTKARKQ